MGKSGNMLEKHGHFWENMGRMSETMGRYGIQSQLVMKNYGKSNRKLPAINGGLYLGNSTINSVNGGESPLKLDPNR